MLSTLWSPHAKTYSRQSLKTPPQLLPAQRQKIEDSSTCSQPPQKSHKAKISDYFKPKPASKFHHSSCLSLGANAQICSATTQNRLHTGQGNQDPTHSKRTRRRLQLKRRGIVSEVKSSTLSTSVASPLESTPTALPIDVEALQHSQLASAHTENDVKSPSLLVQTQIQLGSQPQYGCAVCKFLYNPTISTDKDAHDAFHDHFVNGCLVGPSIPEELVHRIKLIDVNIDEKGVQSYVVTVNGSASTYWKTYASNALEIASRDLGAEVIDPATLWSTTPSSNASQTVYRYKVFLYIRQRRVKSLLLTEHISQAVASHYQRNNTDSPDEPSTGIESLHTSYRDLTYPASMGIARVWTLKTSRRLKLASYLLDCARLPNSFMYGKSVALRDIAFSATTDLGSVFAKAYMKDCFQEQSEKFDFLTYFEDDESPGMRHSIT